MKNVRGKLIILSGPSGVGKGTVCQELLNNPQLNLVYSVSMTTRPRREKEVEGVNYFFVSPEYFLQAITNGELLEYASFVGNFYGTPKSYVDQKLALGKNVILEIELDGASQVLNKVKDCISIFLIPPSLEELKSRLIERQSESLTIINQRLMKAEKELKLQNGYQFVVLNDEVERVVAEITEILLKELQ